MVTRKKRRENHEQANPTFVAMGVAATSAKLDVKMDQQWHYIIVISDLYDRANLIIS